MFIPTKIPQPPAVVVPAPAGVLGTWSATEGSANVVAKVVTVRFRAAVAQDQGSDADGDGPLDLIWG